MKNSLIKLCVMATVLVATNAHADIASVNYVHKYVTKVWDITIPHNAADSNVVSMKYLMSVVDKANAELNGTPTTDYANDLSRATSNIASTAAARDAIENLITKEEETDDCPKNTFCFTPATTTNEYRFFISAAGTYYIDWGDGSAVQTINKTTTTAEDITHTYTDSANLHEIRLTGKATAYSTSINYATIQFTYDSGLSKMSGCLGCIFSTIDEGGEGKQPRFSWTFEGNTELAGEIPPRLFNGVHGKPVKQMFMLTFDSCKRLTGSIPKNLFAGIDTSGEYLSQMFDATFWSCTSLTGPSAKINGKYLYEIWPDVIEGGTYYMATKLTDYDCIPTNWGGGGTKNPGECGE